MNNRNRKNLWTALGLLAAFALWTLAIRYLDVRPIGPNNSEVGFAGINGWFHNLTGVHWGLYTLTDWLGLVPLCFVLGFALLGLWQLVTRKSLFKVDGDIFVLWKLVMRRATVYREPEGEVRIQIYPNLPR